MSCRAVSPIRFFDPILNNALALRASQKICEFLTRHKAFVAFSVDDRARSGGKEVLKAVGDEISRDRRIQL